MGRRVDRTGQAVGLMLSLVGTCTAATAIAAPGASAQAPAGLSVSVSVKTSTTLATVPETAIGLNTSVYDSDLTGPKVPGLLRQAGVTLLRFPGGSESDEYNWATNTDTISAQTEATDFDQFMNVAKKAGAKAMITVNYGTGTPAEAAAWVKYANVKHHDGIRYWEVGNEVYGNGTYGDDWEPDAQCKVSSASGAAPFKPGQGTLSAETPGSAQEPTFNCGPLQYAENVARFARAMQQADPSISVGVVLTAPGNWPDDDEVGYICGGSPSAPKIPGCYWDATVLSELARLHVKVGFADVHWYPQNPSNVTAYTDPPATNGATAGAAPDDANLLATNSQIPAMVSALERRAASDYGRSLPIMVTETNSVSSSPGRQSVSIVNALFLDQDYLSWLDSGVKNVDWWQLHNGIVANGDNTRTDYAGQTTGSKPPPPLYGSTLYGDYGVLSNGSCAPTPATATPSEKTVCEPKTGTPFPAYYGLEMLSRFIRPGDRLLAARSSRRLVQAFAAEGPHQRLAVMVVNDNPAKSFTVRTSVNGKPVAPGSTALSYGAGKSAPVSTHAGGGRLVVPPYSVTVLTL